MTHPQSRLFDDATPVDDRLDTHLSGDYETIEPDSYSTDAWATNVDTEEDDRQRPITWLLGRPGYRAAIQWCLDELSSDDPNLKYHSKTAFAEQTVVSRQALAPLLDDLADIGVLKTKGNKRLRYAINEDSKILRLLLAVDSEIAASFE